MRDFAAIDFETANNERSSVCSVGIVIVRDGEIIDTFYSLIQPEPNYYIRFGCHKGDAKSYVFSNRSALTLKYLQIISFLSDVCH